MGATMLLASEKLRVFHEPKIRNAWIWNLMNEISSEIQSFSPTKNLLSYAGMTHARGCVNKVVCNKEDLIWFCSEIKVLLSF